MLSHSVAMLKCDSRSEMKDLLFAEHATEYSSITVVTAIKLDRGIPRAFFECIAELQRCRRSEGIHSSFLHASVDHSFDPLLHLPTAEKPFPSQFSCVGC